MRATAILILITIVSSGCGSKSGEPARAAGVALKPDDTPAPIPGGESFESPTYKLWAKFPVGAAVTQRTTTENEDNSEKTVTTISYALKEKTDEYVIVESQATTVHYTGRVETNPPHETKTRKMYTLPPGLKKDAEPKHEEGEETLAVAGRTFPSRWYKAKVFTEGGELFSQTWSSDDMPGGLVKSVSKVPSKRATITVEVTEVKIPKA